jgi:hypothetical protein
MSDKAVVIYDEQQHQELLARIHAIETMREGVFIKDVHFGEPYKGAGKPVLLKPGAETIMSRFHLWPEFIERSTVEKWDVDAPVFHYRYECRLVHRTTGEVWGAGIGSCNSLEDRYRWRKLERVCPKCGNATIIKGKAEFGGGWVCWAKKGGCGVKFKDGDPDIEGQPEGKVANDDVFTLVNTLDKMAQKRALVAAVLVATGASAYFTQDVEDFPEYVPAVTVDNTPPVVIDNATGEVEKLTPKPNPRRIPDAPPTDNRLVKPEPAQTPDNGAADEGESHWTNDMARLRKFLAWAEDFWKPIERPHAVNRLANALGINGTPSGNKDLLFEMMLAQQDTVGTPDEAMRAVQLYEPATPPADVKLMPDKDAMPFDGPCDMCGETTVLTVAGGTFRCKACSDKVANEAASALAQKRGKGKKLEPTGTEG